MFATRTANCRGCLEGALLFRCCASVCLLFPFVVIHSHAVFVHVVVLTCFSARVLSATSPMREHDTFLFYFFRFLLFSISLSYTRTVVVLIVECLCLPCYRIQYDDDMALHCRSTTLLSWFCDDIACLYQLSL